MTETEWLAATDPQRMLAYLGDKMRPAKQSPLGSLVAGDWRSGTIFGPSAVTTNTAERWGGRRGHRRRSRQMAYKDVYEAREAAGRMILSDPDSPDPNEGTAGYYAVEAAVAVVKPALPSHLATGVLSASPRSCSLRGFPAPTAKSHRRRRLAYVHYPSRSSATPSVRSPLIPRGSRPTFAPLPKAFTTNVPLTECRSSLMRFKMPVAITRTC